MYQKKSENQECLYKTNKKKVLKNIICAIKGHEPCELQRDVYGIEPEHTTCALRNCQTLWYTHCHRCGRLRMENGRFITSDDWVNGRF